MRFSAASFLLQYPGLADDPKSELPEPPRLPQRAAIYIAPDGSVHFGALFEDLAPVAAALGNAAAPAENPAPILSRGSDGEGSSGR